MNNKFDPRTKILIVMVLSATSVLSKSVLTMLLIVISTVIYCRLFDVKIIETMKKLKNILMLLVMSIIIQSIFNRRGNALISIGHISILTDYGIYMGTMYIMRVFTIVFSGAIIASSGMRNNLYGLSQLGLPYEIGLMVTIGVRFLPILMEEVQSVVMAIGLRGIDLNSLKLNRRLEMIGFLFTPVIYSTIIRAKELAESVEQRGFTIGGKRTAYYKLRFTKIDIIILSTVIILMSLIYIINVANI